MRRNRKHLRLSTRKVKVTAEEIHEDQPSDENPHDEMLRESTSVTPIIPSEFIKSNVTQQASTSTIPNSRTNRSERQAIPPKMMDL